MPLTVEQTRSISLVSGLSYNIMCNAERGFGGSEMVWFRDGVPLPNRAGQTIDPTISSVHAIRVDGNNWRLVLQLFMNSGTGRYTCEGSNGNVSLVIGISTLIDVELSSPPPPLPPSLSPSSSSPPPPPPPSLSLSLTI